MFAARPVSLSAPPPAPTDAPGVPAAPHFSRLAVALAAGAMVLLLLAVVLVVALVVGWNGALASASGTAATSAADGAAGRAGAAQGLVPLPATVASATAPDLAAPTLTAPSLTAPAVQTGPLPAHPGVAPKKPGDAVVKGKGWAAVPAAAPVRPAASAPTDSEVLWGAPAPDPEQTAKTASAGKGKLAAGSGFVRAHRGRDAGDNTQLVTRPVPVDPATGLKHGGFFGLPAGAGTVYLIDASGSLIDTLAFAIAEARRAVASLQPSQQYAVLFFQEQGVMAAAPGRMVPATREARGATLHWLRHPPVIASGRPAAAEGLAAALSLRPDTIVLLSDGITGRGNPAAELELLQRRLRPLRGVVTLHAAQFITADPHARDGVSGLETLARAMGGQYRFVTAADLPADPLAQAETGAEDATLPLGSVQAGVPTAP